MDESPAAVSPTPASPAPAELSDCLCYPKTRTFRSGLHSAAARAAGSCRGLRMLPKAYGAKSLADGRIFRAVPVAVLNISFTPAARPHSSNAAYRAFDERAPMKTPRSCGLFRCAPPGRTGTTGHPAAFIECGVRCMPRRSGVRRHVCALDGCAASLECAGLTALWMDAQRLWITATHQVIVQLSNRILPGALRAHPERRRAAALQTRPAPAARLNDSLTGLCRVEARTYRNPATSCRVSRRPSGGRALLPAECPGARPADGRYFLLRVPAPVRRTGATAGATLPLAAPAG